MDARTHKPPPTLEWHDGVLRLLDQTLLPGRARVVNIRTPEQLGDAIKRLVVRGAPAIGCAAAYGVALAVWRCRSRAPADLHGAARRAADYLATTRPTAVNLFWALDRMRRAADSALALAKLEAPYAVRIFRQLLLLEADSILQGDVATCRAIGRHGAPLVRHRPGVGAAEKRRRPVGVLTHCNAGRLATVGEGTALAVVYEAFRRRPRLMVYADETRPLLQGARLTAWELSAAGVPATLLCDSMAASAMRAGLIDLVVVGADRIAANGDVANKIGTYGAAVLARHHGIPFYVAAPRSTFDAAAATGRDIVIEQRAPEEVRAFAGRPIAPAGIAVHNPAFDVTPAELIDGIITEDGIVAFCKE